MTIADATAAAPCCCELLLLAAVTGDDVPGHQQIQLLQLQLCTAATAAAMAVAAEWLEVQQSIDNQTHISLHRYPASAAAAAAQASTAL